MMGVEIIVGSLDAANEAGFDPCVFLSAEVEECVN